MNKLTIKEICLLILTQLSTQREPGWSILERFTEALSICLNWDTAKLVWSTNMCTFQCLVVKSSHNHQLSTLVRVCSSNTPRNTRKHAWEALRVALRLPSETTDFAQVVVDCRVSAFPNTGSNRSSLQKSQLARRVDNLLSLLLTISTLISSSSVKRGKYFLKESLATTVYGGIILSAITYYFWRTTSVSVV